MSSLTHTEFALEVSRLFRALVDQIRVSTPTIAAFKAYGLPNISEVTAFYYGWEVGGIKNLFYECREKAKFNNQW
jgi:hypothetical protein